MVSTEKSSAEGYWVGIDTGGTFTDVVLVDVASGEYRFRKVASDPADPAEAVLRGLDEILADAGITGQQVGFVGLGTTLATNAVLEGKLGRAAMLVTAGFRDVLELARQRRPHLYNLDIPKPRPPIPPDSRVEVAERINAGGETVLSLNETELVNQLTGLDGPFEAFAVCFLHSYRNPAHEQRAAAILRRVFPRAEICLSSEVSPEFREYERFATTALNAALMPVMARYLAAFRRGIQDRGVSGRAYVIQSNGGLVSPRTLQKTPVNTLFSGPAGGVVGAARVAMAAGFPDVISFDVGGTSTDVCLIRGGSATRAAQREIGGLPVRIPSIDLHTIGAGGGSIAWTDAGGLPKVGPQSAGAIPGPACYGRGGILPTVTDAHVLLGRLNPTALLGGSMPISAAKSRAAIQTHVADALGVDVVSAAAGILDIANLNIVGAVRVISVERGEDPRRYALFAFGGGGPLHAAEVAQALGMNCIIVPPHPGLMSAVGLLGAGLRADFGLTCLVPALSDSLPRMHEALSVLQDRANAWAIAEGVDRDAVGRTTTLAFRYLGQSSELSVSAEGTLDPGSLADVVAAFHTEHHRRFSYAMPDRTVELVTIRLAVEAHRISQPTQRTVAEAGLAFPQTRSVWFRSAGFVATPIHDRRHLAVGARVPGPAVIEQMDTTTVIPPRWTARTDEAGNLIIEYTEEA